MKKKIWRTWEKIVQLAVKTIFCLITSIIASNKRQIHSVDVKSAFLQDKGINKDVYVQNYLFVSDVNQGNEGVAWC